MTWDEEQEIRKMVERIGPALLSTVPTARDNQTPELAQVVGRMMADENMIHIATYATALAVGLDIARQAGAAQADIARVRIAALAETPRWNGGVTTKLATVRLALATEARIVATMTFNSRDAANATLKAMNDVFNAAATVAADDLDAGIYNAIITLQSQLVKALTDQALRLPFIIDYQTVDPVPALRLSQNFYGDGTRAQELVNENSAVHPAFMPREGRMLAT